MSRTPRFRRAVISYIWFIQHFLAVLRRNPYNDNRMLIVTDLL